MADQKNYDESAGADTGGNGDDDESLTDAETPMEIRDGNADEAGADDEDGVVTGDEELETEESQGENTIQGENDAVGSSSDQDPDRSRDQNFDVIDPRRRDDERSFDRDRSLEPDRSFDADRSVDPNRSYGGDRSLDPNPSFDLDGSIGPLSAFGQNRSNNDIFERSLAPKSRDISGTGDDSFVGDVSRGGYTNDNSSAELHLRRVRSKTDREKPLTSSRGATSGAEAGTSSTPSADVITTSQVVRQNLERMASTLRDLQSQFTLPAQISGTFEQFTKQMCKQVGEVGHSMVETNIGAINGKMNRLAAKYEKIKQLEDQMRESDQILDLLLEKR